MMHPIMDGAGQRPATGRGGAGAIGERPGRGRGGVGEGPRPQGRITWERWAGERLGRGQEWVGKELGVTGETREVGEGPGRGRGGAGETPGRGRGSERFSTIAWDGH